MVAMGHIRAVATEERTSEAWVLVPVEGYPERVNVKAVQEMVPSEAVVDRVPVVADPVSVPSRKPWGPWGPWSWWQMATYMDSGLRG